MHFLIHVLFCFPVLILSTYAKFLDFKCTQYSTDQIVLLQNRVNFVFIMLDLVFIHF